MVRRRFFAMLLAILSFWQAADANAQEAQIVHFSADTTPLPFDQVEGGTASAMFRWEALGVTENGFRMQMNALVGGQWRLIGEDFAPTKSDTLVIAHPLTAGPPIYRLSIVNHNGQIVDEALLQLAYAQSDPDGLPVIQSFSAELESLPLDSLQRETLRLPVSWTVSERIASSNLVFVQIMADGSVRSIELPRADSWVRSSGAGVVAPIAEAGASEVTIALQIVDAVTGEVYDQATITLPVIASPQGQPAPEVTEFSVTPQEIPINGSVTFTWNTEGGESVAIREWYDVQGGCHGRWPCYFLLTEYLSEQATPQREFSDQPPDGTLTIAVPDTPRAQVHRRVGYSLHILNGGQELLPGCASGLVVSLTYPPERECRPSVTTDPFARANPGDSVLVTWDACELSNVELEHRYYIGEQMVSEFYTVEAAGTMTLTIPVEVTSPDVGYFLHYTHGQRRYFLTSGVVWMLPWLHANGLE